MKINGFAPIYASKITRFSGNIGKTEEQVISKEEFERLLNKVRSLKSEAVKLCEIHEDDLEFIAAYKAKYQNEPTKDDLIYELSRTIANDYDRNNPENKERLLALESDNNYRVGCAILKLIETTANHLVSSIRYAFEPYGGILPSVKEILKFRNEDTDNFLRVIEELELKKSKG